MLPLGPMLLGQILSIVVLLSKVCQGKKSGIVTFLLGDLTLWFFYNHKEDFVHGHLYSGGNRSDMSHC